MHRNIPLGCAAGIAGLVALSTPLGAWAQPTADSTQEIQHELQVLRAQVDALQHRLDEQTAAGRVAAPAAPAAPVAAAAAAPTAPPQPGVIHYKGVTITLGGFAAAEAVYRSHNQGADIASNFGAIPFNNSAVGHTQELRFTERQSRIAGLVQGDATPHTHLGFYGEFDFLGAAQTANSNESNSFNLRVRNLYGSVDWDTLGLHLLAGQNWSLVTMNTHGITPRNELTPPQIDAQYLPGFVWARQPQLRLTKDFDHKLWLALSLENPQTTYYAGANALPASVHVTYNTAAGSGFNSANTLSLNHIPDVVAKVAYEAPVAGRDVHLEAFGLYRSFYERLNYANHNVDGGGFGFGIVAPLVPGLVDFQVSGLAGRGIGRYGSAQLPDATFDAAGGIRPIHEVDLLAGVTVHPVTNVDVYLFAGSEQESAQSFDWTAPSGNVVAYGYGNPLYSNAGCASETAGGTCVGNTRRVEQAMLGFWHRVYVGEFGKFQWGLQYSYTQRNAFSGAGGAPIGNENMAFASIRYFPF